MSNPQIQSLVAKFAADLQAIIQKSTMENVQNVLRSALGTSGAPARPVAVSKLARKGASAKPAGKKQSRKRVRRSPAELAQDVGRLTSFVKANAGATSEKVRAALGLDKPQWIKALRHAIDSKQLVTKGQKRSTTLHLPRS